VFVRSSIRLSVRMFYPENREICYESHGSQCHYVLICNLLRHVITAWDLLELGMWDVETPLEPVNVGHLAGVW